jgi:hypothetical protein
MASQWCRISLCIGKDDSVRLACTSNKNEYEVFPVADPERVERENTIKLDLEEVIASINIKSTNKSLSMTCVVKEGCSSWSSCSRS